MDTFRAGEQPLLTIMCSRYTGTFHKPSHNHGTGQYVAEHTQLKGTLFAGCVGGLGWAVYVMWQDVAGALHLFPDEVQETRRHCGPNSAVHVADVMHMLNILSKSQCMETEALLMRLNRGEDMIPQWFKFPTCRRRAK